MTIKEIAELCGVKETDTVRNWINREDFLNRNFRLRNQIKEKLDQGSPENPSDYDLEETLEIIGEGGKNKTLAALLAENAANKNALAVFNGGSQLAGLAALMGKVEKALEDPKKAAYEELEAWIGKTVEFEDRPIHRVYIHQLYHAYRKDSQNPLNEHNFKFKIALDHPEFELRQSKKAGWYFAYCSLTRII
jgi:hypothetical protein